MKRNSTLPKWIFLTLTFLSIFSIKGYSQPDYDFTNGSLIAGFDRTVGASYRFTKVKPGVDAIVTITHISAGVTVASMDDGSGYPEALQPSLDVSPGVNGYLDMQIDFVITGTFTLMSQLEIPVTCIDVDGITGSVYEYDQITWGPSAYMDYDMIGNELTINSSPGWMSCKNQGGIDYPGRDTSAKQVMFTVVNANLTTINIRVGADNVNTGSNAFRLRSIYFKRFRFNNSFLPVSELSSFSGVKNASEEISLTAKLIAAHQYLNASVEKSTNGTSFSSIGRIDATGKTSIQFTDKGKNDKGVYYRLKLTDKNGKIGYSNILFFKASESINKLGVFPSIVEDYTNISFNSTRPTLAKVDLYDQSGRLVMKKEFNSQAGTSSYSLNGLSKFPAGQYFVVVSADGSRQTQKIQLIK